LVSQGSTPSRIVILSPNRLEKSSLQGCTRIKEWDLEDFKTARGNCIRFSTIRAFKGLEADVVFLIGMKEGKQTCTDADVYVGGSRARFLLYVFHHREEPPKGMTASM
jgi:superfamily I DNA/RNA helicase